MGWIYCYYSQGVALKDLILLGINSTDTIFLQPKIYVKNIRQEESTLELRTNGGPLVSNQVCDPGPWKGLVQKAFNHQHQFSAHDLQVKSYLWFGERESIFGSHAKLKCAIQTNVKWVVCNEPAKQWQLRNNKQISICGISWRKFGIF